MASKCTECGKETDSGLDMCPRCESQHLIVMLEFDDFIKTLSYNPNWNRKDPSVMDSKVVHLTQEEAGIVIATWIEERDRILKKCSMSGPTCLAHYIYLIHQVCIDKHIRRGGTGFWNALIIVVSFFNKDWCIRRYYDPGDEGNEKQGRPARTRGWKVAVFNPFDYMEWAMAGFKEWVVMWLRAGVTRKELILKAEKIIKEGEE